MFEPSNQEQAKEAVRLSELMVYTALSMDGKSLYKIVNVQCFDKLASSIQTARNLEMAVLW